VGKQLYRLPTFADKNGGQKSVAHPTTGIQNLFWTPINFSRSQRRVKLRYFGVTSLYYYDGVKHHEFYKFIE
jgi:hypothetical protein